MSRLGGDFRRFSFTSGPSGVIPERAIAERPDLSDYLGGLGPAPTIGPPERTNAASREGIREAVGDVARFRGEYNAPTAGAAFQNLMSLAGETTGAVEGATRREAGEAASRAGYTGGFGARSKQAALDRMHATAQAGFTAAHEIRGQALEGYGTATQAATARIVSYNQAKVAEAMGNADRQAQANTQQAMINLEHMGLGMQAHQAYAEAKSEAQRLQAQLDSHFQDQRIDAARYLQMSESIQAQFVTAMAQLEEQSREFDVTQKFKEKGFGEDVRRYDREEQLRLAAQARDPSGRAYGPTNPAPGGAFLGLAG